MALGEQSSPRIALRIEVLTFSEGEPGSLKLTAKALEDTPFATKGNFIFEPLNFRGALCVLERVRKRCP